MPIFKAFRNHIPTNLHCFLINIILEWKVAFIHNPMGSLYYLDEMVYAIPTPNS
jgi:hypothetical protein